jgi:hypothetical protein
MSEMAEAYLRCGRAVDEIDLKQRSMHEMIRIALSPPTRTLGPLEKPRTAERFEFEHDPAINVNAMIDAGGLGVYQMYEHAPLVADPCWIEFPLMLTHEGPTGAELNAKLRSHCGALLISGEDKGTRRTLMIFAQWVPFGGPCDFPYPFLCIAVDGLPLAEGHQLSVFFRINTMTQETMLNYVFSACSALFMLAVPKISEVETVSPSRQVRRACERRGEAPPVEFRRVRMIAGRPNPRSAGGSRGDSGEVHRRRYHHVIGHFRNARVGEGRTSFRLTYVPDFWRGDREKGVIIKDRHVEVPK